MQEHTRMYPVGYYRPYRDNMDVELETDRGLYQRLTRRQSNAGDSKFHIA